MTEKEDVIMSNEVKIFLDAKEELGNIEIDEVRKIMAERNQIKKETSRLFAHLSYQKNKLYDLEQMKSVALDQNERYIKGISFSKKMINDELSNKDKYCVRIPYTDFYIMLDRNNIVWKNDDRAVAYLINDNEYEVFDKDREIIEKVEADELERISRENKEEIENELNSTKGY